MSTNAQELVRQLTENPEVLESMQHMISLLRANPPRISGSSNGGGLGSVETNGPERGAQQCVRPPRSEYGTDADYGHHRPTTRRKLHSSDGTGHSATSLSASSLTQEAHSFYSDDRVGARTTVSGHNAATGGASSPTPTFVATGSRAAPQVVAAASRLAPRRSSLLSTPHEHRPATAPDEQLMATANRLTEAQRRIAELEKELQRTTKRVDQLSDVVQRQKDELQATKDRHALEMEETRHAYNAVIHRKDEVQEEALRQLLKSRQLMVSAAKYEAVVAAKKFHAQQLEKENNTGADDGTGSAKGLAGVQASSNPNEHGTHPGLAPSQTSVNARHSSTLGHGSGATAKYNSALKRDRQNDEEDFVDGAGVATGAQEPGEARYGEATHQRPPMKRTALDTSHLQGSADRAVEGRRGVVATKAETSPAYITTPTPVSKASTALVDPRTESRSARKRRTPRTPSRTNAERLAGSMAENRIRSQQRLPGTASLKIESPTPVVSTAWTADRSLTGSCTPPPSSAGMYTVSEAVTKHHQLHPQQHVQQAPSTRPPLMQRAAGRLPPAPHRTAAAPTAVPNTRSGTSSIASGGPTRSPSPVNPKRGAMLPRRFIFTGLKDHEPQRLVSAIAAVGDDAAALASDLDEPPPSSTTHVVLRGTPRSVKALCGVVSGKWLVSPEYVYNSQQSGFWLDELEEGGLRIFPPPLKCQRFLLTVEHPSIRAKLAQVIEYGGGEVLPSGSDKRGPSAGDNVAQDVIVITSGDDLLRYATQDRV
ncbi:kinetoplastid kinetochore protein 4 [Leishmania donovani]|uniref:Kinetoplastid_kinetochore_protein_4_putative/Gene DB:LmjF.10.0300 n=1 Tax=Leishmania donovani TaxID=5661 RepID=A0A504XRI2_LEIDO|nr:hypothetical protein CGC20_36055 [Leishmania donovani]CAJ1986706.1 kinetoplastid kinetochore protein 4 [Leishmania donovani]VDZ42602.1 kinetoplastid_kinetochore_protein_4_putative/GeneDB:LmjF.10.0300 [Leishmania donovani]